jgi:AraC-like DNA-binding protein
VPDADAVARIAETDATAAWLQLREQIAPVATSSAGWAEMLAADLVGNPQRSLGDWARAQRLAPETLSRGFQKLFGVTPAVFRAETRARKAFARIVSGAESLAAIAAASGFADQAHMSRATKALTGKTPGHWRASSNSFKTRTTLPG